MRLAPSRFLEEVLSNHRRSRLTVLMRFLIDFLEQRFGYSNRNALGEAALYGAAGPRSVTAPVL
jgi:hypothetical protein|tara:strand:- start:1567 stop:1758 length:192 start_codon:yes stop_codon:yes gene_type:complete